MEYTAGVPVMEFHEAMKYWPIDEKKGWILLMEVDPWGLHGELYLALPFLRVLTTSSSERLLFYMPLKYDTLPYSCSRNRKPSKLRSELSKTISPKMYFFRPGSVIPFIQKHLTQIPHYIPNHLITHHVVCQNLSLALCGYSEHLARRENSGLQDSKTQMHCD